ncbi:MAG TPA: DUF4188 domain-containing protein [Deltaproteobacteria bacterium]|jgi:hypothetical protein|nr:DUF4188 domain-containing protein [Deltaproteobacteria bacterium]
MKPVRRETVDLSNFPDLVVIYLGMRVRKPSGIKTILGFGPRISRSVEARPDGLLLHESLVYSLFPPHVGMRQVWRDFESLERWTRSKPHADWWRQYLRNSGGTSFWHETYRMRGGIEAVYIDLPKPVGLMNLAPIRPARGHLFSARGRLHLSGEGVPRPAVAEEDLYPERG